MLSAQFIGATADQFSRTKLRLPETRMSQNVPSSVQAAAASVGKIKHLRWYICALLFFATVINYVDRQVLGVLEPDYLKPAIGWSEIGRAS